MAEPPLVVLVQTHRGWPADLVAAIGAEGYALVRIDDVRLAPFYVLSGGVAAILVDVRDLDMMALVALRECRAHAEAHEQTLAVVAIACEPAPAPPPLKRALESGATTVLSWPASPAALAQALRGGAHACA